MHRVVIATFAGLAVVIGALGIAAATQSNETGRSATSPSTPAGAGPERASATTTTAQPRRGNGQAVTFAFGGDVHFEGRLRSLLDSNPTGMLSPISPALSQADVAMVNLESAIGDRGSPVPKNFNFRAPARAFEALRAAGVDVVTMANNHGVDYGPVGLQDTLAAKAATPLGVVGIGANAAQAYTPWTTNVRGQRVTVFGASDVIDDALIGSWTATDTQGGIASTKTLNQARLIDAVRVARPNTDTLAVYLHWGAEGTDCPTPRQEELAHSLVDAGADIVVGSHTHRVMSAGRQGAALVDYGLGNFVFYNESGPSGVTGVLNVTATGRDIDSYTWKPARIQGSIPHLLTGPDADRDIAGFNTRRACTNLLP